MNYPDDQQGKMNVIDLSTFYFVRLFRGFSLSVQPGKILLAIIIVFALYGAGWLLDFLAGGSHTVVSDDIYDFNKGSEIVWYAGNCRKADDSITNVKEFRRVTVENHTEKLMDVLSMPVMKDTAGENPLQLVRSGAVKSLLRDKYCVLYEKCLQVLPVRYKITHANMIEGFNRSKQASKEDKMEFNFQQRQLLDDIDKAYTQISHAMIDGRIEGDIDLLLGKVITVDVKLTGKEYSDDLLYYAGLKKDVADVILLAQAMKTAQAIEGRGVFSAIAEFKLTRLHNLAVSMVLLDFEQVKDIVYELAFGSVWMFRYHPYYVLILYLVAFGIYAIFGGAICRISALQVTRQEHVGTIESLHFSFRHFRQLFLVPVMPILVVAGCGLIILVSSWLSLIPYIGPLFMALSLVVIFGLGFLMAIITIGLVVGHGLMYPAVAVDDADAFDAMSRAFTYIIRKPWHLAAYAFIAAIYGIICYVFLRAFLLILFACVRESFASGWDIDVVWPVPSFTILLPPIQWHLLSGGEEVCAGLIRLACQAVVLILPAYACSYYYTTATQIYVMLRKHEDEIDLSECYLETHVNELFEGISFPHKHAEDKDPAQSGTTCSGGEQQAVVEGESADNDQTISDINVDESNRFGQ